MSGHVILKLNETPQLLFYAGEVYPLEVNIITTKITEASIDHSREVGLGLSTDHVSMCCCIVTRMQRKFIAKIYVIDH
jgi:hypothetical protein